MSEPNPLLTAAAVILGLAWAVAHLHAKRDRCPRCTMLLAQDWMGYIVCPKCDWRPRA